MLKTKDAGLKQVAASASLSAWLVGVTEPAIYGCNLRLKKPMICAVIAGALGGGIMGIGKAVNTGFANNGILTIMSLLGRRYHLRPVYGLRHWYPGAFVGAAVLTYLVGFEDVDVKLPPLPPLLLSSWTLPRKALSLRLLLLWKERLIPE